MQKVIEYGLFGTRLGFPALVYLRALATLQMDPPVEWRRDLFKRIEVALRRKASVPEEIEVGTGTFFRLHVRSLTEDVANRLGAFRRWVHARVVVGRPRESAASSSG